MSCAEHQIGHVLDAADHLVRMEFAAERDHALGDVLGEIADALEIVRDAQRADDLAQIDRHRLAPRDGEDRPLLDLALQRVDGRIERDDALGELAVAPRQRIDRFGDLLFGEPAHFGDHAGEILQVDVEGFRGVLVNHVFRFLPDCIRRAVSAEAAGDVVLRAAIARVR